MWRMLTDSSPPGELNKITFAINLLIGTTYANREIEESSKHHYAWLYKVVFKTFPVQNTQQKIKHITYNKGKGVWYPADTV